MIATKKNVKAKTKPEKATTKAETHGLLIEIAQLLSESVDVEQLTADGVLKKRGGGWYELIDPDRLPEQARSKIKTVKSGNRVRFRKPSKRARKFLDSIETAAQPA